MYECSVGFLGFVLATMSVNCFETLENHILEGGRGKCKTRLEFEGFIDVMKNESRSIELLDESDDDDDKCRIVDEGKWNANLKRKRECYNEMLKWIRDVAKNQCDSKFGVLADRSRWKFDELCKQVVFAREQFVLKRKSDSSDPQSIWQKKQRMHPTMYEDQPGLTKSRISQRVQTLSSEKSKSRLSSQSPSSSSSSSSPALQSDNEDRSNKQSESSIYDLWIFNHRQKKTPVAPRFQAKVPDWTNVAQESDKKWLGTQIWPLDIAEKKNHLIERDSIGKGRQDSCGCENQGSVECVRFHISEKKNKLKLELCSAFQKWKFDEVGEQITMFWTEQEENEIIKDLKLSFSSLEEGYFEKCNAFTKRSKKEIVRYYFNVFLLRRRSYQNRFTPNNIGTDDDEPESESENICVPKKGINSTGSIFRSPRKAR